MFSPSVWRAASTAPQAPIVSPFMSSAPRRAASQILSYRNHQRRYSSSKPSSPAGGSNGVTDGQTVPATPTHARPDTGKKSSRTSRKKARDGAPGGKGKVESLQNIPSVPSTQHIAPNQLAASDFFSLHRPISITNNFPKAVTEDAFASIFTPRVKTNTKPSEVISTLSRTLNNMDTVTGNMKQLKLGAQQEQGNEETDELQAAITAESYQKAEVQHINASPDGSMNFPHHILSGRFQPFNPPPPPVPMSTPESLAAAAEAAAETQESQYRTYTAVLTIEESTDMNGDVTYQAHSSPLVAEDQPTSTRFLERMQARQERYRIHRAAELDGMFAISVKRQRKLKMKKHKYKKLMRRTRNLRRRLDRN